jgi:hypothetical protein
MLRFAPAHRERLAELPSHLTEVHNGLNSHDGLAGMVLERYPSGRAAAETISYNEQ